MGATAIFDGRRRTPYSEIQDHYTGVGRIASMTGAEQTGSYSRNTAVGGSCLYYDGVDDYTSLPTIDLGSNQSLVFVIVPTVFSTTYPTLIRKWGTADTSSNENYHVRVSGLSANDGKTIYRVGNGVTFAYALGASTLQLNQKYHIACTYDGIVMKIYVNGILDGLTTTSIVPYIAATSYNWLGSFSSAGGIWNYGFRGFMHEVQLWNKTLTEQDIIDLYLGDKQASGITDYATYCRAWYRHQDGIGATLSDETANNYDGTISGSIWDTKSIYSRHGKLTSRNMIRLSGTGEEFRNTLYSKPGGTRAELQFSNDGISWKNSFGKQRGTVGCYSFDRVNDYMYHANHADFNPGASDFAIGMWYKRRAVVDYEYLLSKYTLTGNKRSWVFRLGNTDNKLYFATDSDGAAGGGTGIETVLPCVTTGLWHYIFVTKVGTVGSIYVDGVRIPDTGTALSNPFAAVCNVDLSSYESGTGLFAGGDIRDVVFYNGTTPNQTQIGQLMRGEILPTDLTNCKLWLKLDADTNDYSGNAHHFTNSGATLVTNWWRSRQLGNNVVSNDSVLFFDGTGDYVTVADRDEFSFGNGLVDSPFSIEAWIKSAAPLVNLPILSKYALSTDKEYRLIISLGKLHITVFDKSVSAYLGRYCNIATVPSSIWLHVSGTYNGSGLQSGLKLYINGFQVDDANNSGGSYVAMENTTTPVHIGAEQTVSYSANGVIGCVALYKDLRTQEEIIFDAQSGYFDVSDTNLVSLWTINEGYGTTVVDAKNGYNGTIVGNPQWVRDEFRPIAISPTLNYLGINNLSFWNPLYYRTFFDSIGGVSTPAFDEITVAVNPTLIGVSEDFDDFPTS